MSSLTSTAVQKFEQRFEELKTKGLVDMKFFVGEVSDATAEDFCAEFLRMDQLIQKGEVIELELGKSAQK